MGENVGIYWYWLKNPLKKNHCYNQIFEIISTEPNISTLLEIFTIYTPNHISENFQVINKISED